jgi:hypothetical protein
MTSTDLNVFAVNAAKYFLEAHSCYIVCPENSKILTAEILRLVNEGADPSAVTTYDRAFQNCWELLTLAEERAQPKTPEELTNEEIAVLSPVEQERLPGPVLRRFANWELKQRKQKPVLSEADTILKELFEENGFAYSAKNKATIGGWMDARGLGYSAANLTQAIDACESGLEPSEQAIADMSSEEYKQQIVDPTFREWQAKQAQPEPSRTPLGVRWTRYLHEK